MKTGLLIGGLLLLFYLRPGEAVAQPLGETFVVNLDTSYITAYKDELTTRLFLSRKQNGYNLSDRLLSPWIKYKTNDNLLLGLGYTYSFLTINLAVKFPFINGDDDRYGESKYLDLQAHTILRSFIIDFYAQWNEGYYISNSAYHIRGDMRTNLLGMNIRYLFNSERYSYKAAFLQNEFQRKSAGSPMAGVEGYWVMGMTDSLMVAGDIPPIGFLGNHPFNQTDVFNFGINGGYAYTFVWQETLYLSLSTSFGTSVGKNRVHNTATSATFYSGFSAGFTNSTHISFGYNNKNYYVGLSYRRFALTSKTGTDSDWLGYNTGNIRLNIVKRFITKKPIKILRPDLWVF